VIQLASSWQKVRFDQICKNISNRIDDPKQANTNYYVGLEHLDSEEPKILRHGSPQDVSKTKLLFKPGHILFGKRNWYLRRLAVAQREGICSAHMLVLEPIEGKITKEFLPLLMFSDEFYEKALMVSAGSMSPTIKWKDIAKLEFLIPPIPEQETTLSLTHQIDDAIAKTQDLLEKTKIYFISSLKTLVTRGIGHTKFKKVKWIYGKTIDVPIEWEIRKFDDLFEFLITGTNSRSDLKNNGDIQYIHYGDIHKKWNYILDCNSEEIPYIDKTKVEKLPLLKDGDLIIVDASEDYEGSGTSILLKNVNNKKIVSGLHTIALHSYDENISLDFKVYLTSIPSVKSQIIRYVTGISVYGLSKNNLKKIMIPLPPLPEQKQITSILSNIQEQISQQQSHISNLKTMRKSILNSKLTPKMEEKLVAQ